MRILLVGAGGYYLLTSWLDRRAEREDPEAPIELAAEVGGASALPAGADATAARNLTVGMVLDGSCVLGRASSILDLTGEAPRVIREGAIPAERLIR